MQRAQIVLDEPTADRLRSLSQRSKASMSEIVREALALYFAQREPDTAWIGSLKAKPGASHDLDDIRASVVAGRRREARR